MSRMSRWFSERNLFNSSEETQTNSAVLRELNCGKCNQYMQRKIFQCVRGHVICDTCVGLTVECCHSDCGSPLSTTRNHPLERIAQAVRFPCSYHSRGCGGSYRIEQIKEHETRCVRRPIRCLVESTCDFVGSRDDLPRHVRKKHGERLLATENHLVHKEFRNAPPLMVRLVEAFGEVFWYYHMRQEEMLYFSIYHLGSDDGTDRPPKEFLYDLTMKCPREHGPTICYTEVSCERVNQEKLESTEEEERTTRRETAQVKISALSMRPLLVDDRVKIWFKMKKNKRKRVASS